jgi:hypothetical protein
MSSENYFICITQPHLSLVKRKSHTSSPNPKLICNYIVIGAFEHAKPTVFKGFIHVCYPKITQGKSRKDFLSLLIIFSLLSRLFCSRSYLFSPQTSKFRRPPLLLTNKISKCFQMAYTFSSLIYYSPHASFSTFLRQLLELWNFFNYVLRKFYSSSWWGVGLWKNLPCQYSRVRNPSRGKSEE